jgi:hypothetical protein
MAPEAPNTACWRSVSTITCDVISQPPAQSRGVAAAHRIRSTTRIGIDAAWADPADPDLHGAEDRAADEPAEGRRRDGVDVAGDGSRRDPRQREPDESAEPAGPALDLRPVPGHVPAPSLAAGERFCSHDRWWAEVLTPR